MLLSSVHMRCVKCRELLMLQSRKIIFFPIRHYSTISSWENLVQCYYVDLLSKFRNLQKNKQSMQSSADSKEHFVMKAMIGLLSHRNQKSWSIVMLPHLFSTKESRECFDKLDTKRKSFFLIQEKSSNCDGILCNWMKP